VKPKKRYRLTIWRRINESPGGSAYWHKTNHRELDQHEADLLAGVACNMGWGRPWCDSGHEIADRLITVERL
jgi:hypothetical protein